MSTRIVIEVEDLDEDSAGGLGLWLDMILREETQHEVRSVKIEQEPAR